MPNQNEKAMNGWWDDEEELLELNVGSLPKMFRIDKPWDIINNYPEAAWITLKTLHDENVALKAEVEKLNEAARMYEKVRSHGHQ
jgi:hypothetical protein